MKRITLLFAAMATAILLTTSGIALSQASNGTFTERIPFTSSVVNPCNGETVVIEGHLKTLIHTTTNDNADILVESAIVQGSGLGSVTGARYVVHQTEMIEQALILPGGEFAGGEITAHRRTNITGKGRVPDFSARTLAHFTFTTAQGPTAEVFFTDIECRG
jgi:hypothetical protein